MQNLLMSYSTPGSTSSEDQAGCHQLPGHVHGLSVILHLDAVYPHCLSSLLPIYLSAQNHLSSQLNDLSNSPLVTMSSSTMRTQQRPVNNNNKKQKPDYVTPTVHQEELDTTALEGSI